MEPNIELPLDGSDMLAGFFIPNAFCAKLVIFIITCIVICIIFITLFLKPYNFFVMHACVPNIRPQQKHDSEC